jgi:hypothetical protein
MEELSGDVPQLPALLIAAAQDRCRLVMRRRRWPMGASRPRLRWVVGPLLEEQLQVQAGSCVGTGEAWARSRPMSFQNAPLPAGMTTMPGRI